MTIRPLLPDVPRPDTAPSTPSDREVNAFARAVDAVRAIFEDAQRAENAYASGAGSLRDAVYERARADVAISVAASAAQRAAQAMQTLLSMQI